MNYRLPADTTTADVSAPPHALDMGLTWQHWMEHDPDGFAQAAADALDDDVADIAERWLLGGPAFGNDRFRERMEAALAEQVGRPWVRDWLEQRGE